MFTIINHVIPTGGSTVDTNVPLEVKVRARAKMKKIEAGARGKERETRRVDRRGGPRGKEEKDRGSVGKRPRGKAKARGTKGRAGRVGRSGTSPMSASTTSRQTRFRRSLSRWTSAGYG